MRLLEFEELSYCWEICHYEQMLACIITLRPLLFFWKWPHASEAHNQRRTNERTRLGREARESNVWNRVRECRGLRRTRGKKSPFRPRMTFSVTPGSFHDDERMGPRARKKWGTHGRDVRRSPTDGRRGRMRKRVTPNTTETANKSGIKLGIEAFLLQLPTEF